MVPFPSFGPLRCRGRVLPLDQRVVLMGVLNVTPDSFSDGGVYMDPGAAVEHAIEMVQQGADLIDIGAESSRPGADPIDEAEECRRLLPALTAICRQISVPVSVDTTKAGVAERALGAGAAIINDISALRADPRMGPVVAQADAGLVLMHMRGTPKTMQSLADYDDVVVEVRAALAERLDAAERAGVPRESIVLDPGIGFGKNSVQNLQLLARLDELHALGRPLLVGPSRKAFIGELTGRRVAAERVMGTAAAAAAAIERGARMLRVHDVGAIREVVKVTEAIVASSSLQARHP